MLSDKRKISILKKIAQLCKSKSHPTFTQANIRRRAHEKGWPENQKTKGTLSKYLNTPETSYENVPIVFYDVMLEMLKEEEINLPTSKEDAPTINDFYAALSAFMSISPDEDSEAKEALPGTYWMYMPSISRPGCIVKALLYIREERSGSLSAEELMYYPNEGCSGHVKQISKGHIVGKDGHSLMMLNDPSSYMPKLYMMRTVIGPNRKSLRLSGGGMMVNTDTDSIKIMHRKIVCVRTKEALPKDKKTLIEKHGMGIHDKYTKDEVILGLFDTLSSSKHGQAFFT